MALSSLLPGERLRPSGRHDKSRRDGIATSLNLVSARETIDALTRRADARDQRSIDLDSLPEFAPTIAFAFDFPHQLMSGSD
ncbi:MAG: hypothetical protein WA766_05140, partial [Candidatus Acidiferrales bacterium]